MNRLQWSYARTGLSTLICAASPCAFGDQAGADASRVAAAAPSPQQMVDALHAAFGDHHSRAVHAKGIMALGTFTPVADAATLSKAPIFILGALPILVRFSDFTGIPEIPDTVGDANPRGFALKIKLPDGSTADVVSHSFNGFPTATSAEFRELLLSISSSGANAAKPTALDSFLGSHPIAKNVSHDAEAGSGELCNPQLFRRQRLRVYGREGTPALCPLPFCTGRRRGFADTSTVVDQGAGLSSNRVASAAGSVTSRIYVVRPDCRGVRRDR